MPQVDISKSSSSSSNVNNSRDSSLNCMNDRCMPSVQMSESSGVGSSMESGNRLPSEIDCLSVSNDLSQLKRGLGQMFDMVAELRRGQNVLMESQQAMMSTVMSLMGQHQQKCTLESFAHDNCRNFVECSQQTLTGTAAEVIPNVEVKSCSIVGLGSSKDLAVDAKSCCSSETVDQKLKCMPKADCTNLADCSQQTEAECTPNVEIKPISMELGSLSNSISNAGSCGSVETVEQIFAAHCRQKCAFKLYSKRLEVGETPAEFCDTLKRLYRAAWPDRDECFLKQDVFVLFLNGMPTEVIDQYPIPSLVGLDQAVVWASMAIDKLEEEKVQSVSSQKLHSLQAISETVGTSDKSGSSDKWKMIRLNRSGILPDCAAHSNDSVPPTTHVQNEEKWKPQAQCKVTSVDQELSMKKFDLGIRRNHMVFGFNRRYEHQLPGCARVSSPQSVLNVKMARQSHLHSHIVMGHGEVGVSRIEQADDLTVEHLGPHVVQYWRTRKKVLSPANDAQAGDGPLEN
jgi:hypothetical protein